MKTIKTLMVGATVVLVSALASAAHAGAQSQLVFSPLQCQPANAYAEKNIVKTTYSVRNRGERPIILLCPLANGYGPTTGERVCGTDFSRYDLWVQFLLKPAISGAQTPIAWLSMVSYLYNPDVPTPSYRVTRGKAASLTGWNGTTTHLQTAATPSVSCSDIETYSSTTARVRLPASGEITYIHLVER